MSSRNQIISQKKFKFRFSDFKDYIRVSHKNLSLVGKIKGEYLNHNLRFKKNFESLHVIKQFEIYTACYSERYQRLNVLAFMKISV